MNIFFTFDYELFLGLNTGTINNSLIIPMNKITQLLDKYNIKSTIFVDAAYLLRLKELGGKYEILRNEYDKIKEHICLMHTTGQDIQLHFHPQWIYSIWDDEKWIMDTKHYKLSDMDENVALEKLNAAHALLENLLNKKITAFRAGGYSLTTFDNYIKFFNTASIIIDSSVLRNACYSSIYQSYDYRNIPAKTIYNFSSNICLEDNSGKNIELSITTKPYNPVFYYILRKYYECRYRPIVYGDGTGIGFPGNIFNTMRRYIRQLLKEKMIQASIDGVSVFFLSDIYSYVKDSGEKNMVIIGHPKSLTNISLKQLDKFLSIAMMDCRFLTASNIP